MSAGVEPLVGATIGGLAEKIRDGEIPDEVIELTRDEEARVTR